MDNLNEIPVQSLQRFYERLMLFLPGLLFAILIFLIGLLLGLLLRHFLTWLFRIMRVDKIAVKTGATNILTRGGLKYPLSEILAKTISGLVVIFFAGLSLVALNIPSADMLIGRLVLFLPNLFAAALIIFFGFILGNFIARAVLITLVNSGLRIAGAVAVAVKVTIVILSITMALEQIGIGGETIVLAFAILFGGAVLAISLAVGLGGKDIAKRYLERKLEGKEEADEFRHI